MNSYTLTNIDNPVFQSFTYQTVSESSGEDFVNYLCGVESDKAKLLQFQKVKDSLTDYILSFAYNNKKYNFSVKKG